MRTALLGTEHACEARAGAKVHGTREGHHGQSRPHSPHCPDLQFPPLCTPPRRQPYSRGVTDSLTRSRVWK